MTCSGTRSRYPGEEGANGDEKNPVPTKPIEVECGRRQGKRQQASRHEAERRAEHGRPQEVFHDREHGPAVDTP
jgi:hypothetical protein